MQTVDCGMLALYIHSILNRYPVPSTSNTKEWVFLEFESFSCMPKYFFSPDALER